MLLKDNTNYLNGNLKIFMYWLSINCTWINSVYKITDFFHDFFHVETIPLFSSQQFGFHNTAREHILKEHFPISCPGFIWLGL